MKRLSRRVLALAVIAVLPLMFFSGCGKRDAYVAPTFAMPDTFSMEASGVVAENDTYELSWDQERACVLLKNKATGYVWSTVPYDRYQSEDSSNVIDSPIYIEYLDKEANSVRTSRALGDSIEYGTVNSKRVENGVTVELYFEDIQIMVPVTYTLREEGLAVSVNTKEIRENENHLLSISLAPYLCSTLNGSKEDYLVVPNGSGALMYATEDLGGARTYEGEVYGSDSIRRIAYEPTEETALNMPFFGVKSGENALCAIIEKGTGMAFINATAGNDITGYSNIYTRFLVRNYDVIEASVNWKTTEMKLLAESMSVNSDICVLYQPLSGASASYTGMAQAYRAYLQQQNQLGEKQQETASYGLTFLGGAMVDKDLFGVPYRDLLVSTTYEQVQITVKELAEKTGSYPSVNLKGFGTTGLDTGKVGGGYAFSGKYGSKADREALLTYFTENQANLFYDMDLVYYSNSGKGFSTISDKAQTANKEPREQYLLSKPFHNELAEGISSFLLSRSALAEAMEKAIAFGQKAELPGLSFATLGSEMYSDYVSGDYESRGGMDTQVSKLLADVHTAGMKVSVSAGNAYAAAAADTVFDAPTSHGLYEAFDAEIPLYALVFRGYRELVSEPINLAVNANTALLKAVESGVTLGYTMIGSYDAAFVNTPYAAFYGSLAEDVIDDVLVNAEKTKSYYNAIQGATITAHTRLENGVSETVFDNGVTVYTNFGDTAQDTPAGKVEAAAFAYMKLKS